jgi:FlaA1/EpsC-like NDP-sugar epimerase
MSKAQVKREAASQRCEEGLSGHKENNVNLRRRDAQPAKEDDGYEEYAAAALARSRSAVLGVLDVVVWVLSILGMAGLVAAGFGYDMVLGRSLVLALVAGICQIAAGLITKLYLGRWPIGSADEVNDLFITWAAAMVAVVVAGLTQSPRVLTAAGFVAAPLLALALMAAPRLIWRRRLDLALAQRFDDSARRVIVFGAGEGGHQILRSMIRDANSGYHPVALLDDSPAKRHRTIYGVEVAGNRDNIKEVAERFDADLLVVALPSAGSRLIGEIYDIGIEAGIEVRVLPSTSELMGLFVGVSDIRPLTEQDLLGRDEVEIDVDRVAEYITGRKVLVTGAGGSIGSELCRQLHRFAPEELIMLDRDENALHGLQLSIEGRALLDNDCLVVADIRDRDRIMDVMQQRRPDVVFHAAALKHVTLLEQNPDEGLKTNALGTYNVLRAAAVSGVTTFVNVSTDKAADPCNTLGYTKQLAERFTASMADKHTDCRFVSVRFGNVLGSRGSVLPTFRAQIEAGGPVTVTDPDVTRYFMTIPEATRLVMEAGAIGETGEILILDMGEAVKIADLAKRLIAHSKPGTRIEFTGLRPGEKMHEILLAGNEIAVRRDHDRIMHTHGDPLSAEQVELAETEGQGGDLTKIADLSRVKQED